MTFSFNRVWNYHEQEYQREVEAGRRRDARRMIGGLVVVIIAFWIGIAFAGDGDPGSRAGGSGAYGTGTTSNWRNDVAQVGGYFSSSGRYLGGVIQVGWQRFNNWLASWYTPGYGFSPDRWRVGTYVYPFGGDENRFHDPCSCTDR